MQARKLRYDEFDGASIVREALTKVRQISKLCRDSRGIHNLKEERSTRYGNLGDHAPKPSIGFSSYNLVHVWC